MAVVKRLCWQLGHVFCQLFLSFKGGYNKSECMNRPAGQEKVTVAESWLLTEVGLHAKNPP